MSETAITVVAVDQMKGDVLVHFSNGLSVLYHAQFLFDVREHDNNLPIAVDEDIEDAEES